MLNKILEMTRSMSMEPHDIDVVVNTFGYDPKKKKKNWGTDRNKSRQISCYGESAEENMLTTLLEKLSKGRRSNLKDSDFAIPELRKFPIQSKKQARVALTFATWPSLKKYRSRVVKAVTSRYPDLKGVGASKGKLDAQ
ncbi:MAG: hypothetical protein HQK96_18520 [Nitrospirae bacterium]|nr:hypothetical protein [Nitrospirota bacterium]